MPTKRMVVIADLHSGHEFGLTPPDWFRSEGSHSERIAKSARFQRVLWDFYTRAIDALKPIDILVVNGDAIEGKGERSGGVELITPDRHEQIRMAKEAIDYVGAEKIRISYGTRYHVGKDEDFESMLAESVKGDIVKSQGHGFLNVNGVNFDIKHKVGSSTIPHGRLTALARARLWNVVWHAEHERQPKADVIIRSHVHYYGFGGGPSWVGITTPALCYNSSFGIRECEGLVDVGLLVFDIGGGKDEVKWNPVLAEFSELKVQSEYL